jgi:hypothetical protein
MPAVRQERALLDKFSITFKLRPILLAKAAAGRELSHSGERALAAVSISIF